MFTEDNNPFKTALREGKRMIGMWLALADPYSASICAGAGFDWLLIDGEHAPNDLRTILAQLQATAAFKPHVVVRPPSQDAAFIKQLLDLGACNLLIPIVESARQAQELVAAIRYPPRGIRGVGSSIARASNFSRNTNYMQSTEENICLILQVESLIGIQALEEIASVDGVDGIFIGPADLAASMGHLGEPQHEKVQAVICDAGHRIRSLGKAAGILGTNDQVISNYLKWDYTFVAVGVDTLLLAHATSQLVLKYK